MKNKIVKLLICSAGLVLISCSTPQQETSKISAPKASPKALSEFKEGLQLYKAKKSDAALKKFIKYTQSYPNTDLTNDSYFLIGQIYYEQNDYFKAYRYWIAVVDSKTYSQYFDKALIGAAQCQTQLNHIDEALNLISRYKQKPEAADKTLNIQAYELSSRLKTIKGQGYDALVDLLKVYSLKKTNQEKLNVQYRAEEIVKNNIPQSSLEQMISQEEFALVEAAARFKLGTFLYDQKSWPASKRQFEIVREKFPKSEYAQKSLQYANFVDSQERVENKVVGIILPLSGKYSQQGYKVLHGIEMAVGIFNHSNATGIKLAIQDSEGNPEVAKRAVDKLVSEDHVIAIIGDVAGKTSQTVAQRSQELGVPCLTLSQKQGLTEIGEFIFRNNLTPDMQMKQLVNYAMKVRGYKRFAILYPNDTYGTEYATAFWDYVLVNGGTITGAQSYSPEETDFRQPIQRMVGTFFAEEDRGKEFQIRLADWKKQQNPKTAREKPPKDLLPPIVDFDAIFIPDSPKTLGQVAPMLSYNDVDKIPLLGTNLWNTSQIFLRANKFLENSLFIDELFGEDTSTSMKKFTQDFSNQFSYKPDIFEIQGYDSANLVLRTIQNNSPNSRKAMRDALAAASKVSGAASILSVNAQRDVEKTLIPLTVKGGQIVKADN